MRLKKSELVAGVVVGIIIVVLAYYGAYIPIRNTPLKICQSRLKELSTGLQIYASSYGALPPARAWRDLLSDKRVRSMDAFVCPEVHLSPAQYQQFEQRKAAGIEFSVPHIPDGYAIFRPITGIAGSRIADPAHTPLLYDSNLFLPNASDNLESLDFRHYGRRANVVFTDAHMEALPEAPQVPANILRAPGEPPATAPVHHEHEH